jgi:hypothetical protein
MNVSFFPLKVFKLRPTVSHEAGESAQWEFFKKEVFSGS